jgi:rRNA maturation protein Rpf1
MFLVSLGSNKKLIFLNEKLTIRRYHYSESVTLDIKNFDLKRKLFWKHVLDDHIIYNKLINKNKNFLRLLKCVRGEAIIHYEMLDNKKASRQRIKNLKNSFICFLNFSDYHFVQLLFISILNLLCPSITKSVYRNYILKKALNYYPK